MTHPLAPWQIPRRPLPRPPGKAARWLFRIVRRVVATVVRWYRRMETDALIRKLKFSGTRPIINGPAVIGSPENVIFGRDVGINPGFYANAAGGLKFGNHVHVGRNVRILTQNHNYNQPECLPYDKTRLPAQVTIGDCVWIGDNVLIVPGVSIGEGAVIGMGSVVTKDVPALAVVGGAPATVIKMRDPETYWRLKREGKFLNWPVLEPQLNPPGAS